MLECKNLTLYYHDGKDEKLVFRDVNCSFDKGERYVLLGPSGCGKSSLLYLLSGLRKPSDGEVTYRDVALQNASADELARLRRSDFSFIFQMHFLIPYMSVEQNVLAGLCNADDGAKDRASKLLRALKIEDKINCRPCELSGGERQRVAIARALIKNPRVLFADEPTASLDHATAKEAYRLISELSDATLIMATHDASILDGTERIVRFDGHTVCV
ncbi:MAG: ABC transporter ATP-binding protein [Christensenellales bacterium]